MKNPVEGGMRVKSYPVLVRAVEEGVRYGWNRAYKHTATPTPDHVQDAIAQAVLNEIAEYFTFDEDAER